MIDWLVSLYHTNIAGISLDQILNLDAITSFLGSILIATLILLASLILSSWVGRRVRKLGEDHKQLDDTLFGFIANLVRYSIVGFGILFILNTFGIQTTSIVAVIGAAGLAIGLALQGTLSNVAAGVMIVTFRPFKLGDYIIVAGQDGTVKDITLNFIELATLDNLKVTVPNSQVWGNTIVNYSVYPTRRAEWTFGVAYGADLAKAEKIIHDTIMGDPRSINDPEPFIQINALGNSSVDFLVRVWVSSDDYFIYQADMKRAVKEAFDSGGIDIPFPTRTIVMQSSADT